MRLNAPTQRVWYVALILLILGIIGVVLALAKIWNPPWLLAGSAIVEVLAGAILAVATAPKRM